VLVHTRVGLVYACSKTAGCFPGSHQHLKQQTSHPRLWRWNLNENMAVMMREADGEILVGLLFPNLRAVLMLDVCVTSTNTLVLVWVRHFMIQGGNELDIRNCCNGRKLFCQQESCVKVGVPSCLESPFTCVMEFQVETVCIS
jgi:hypothetical protein